MKAGLAELELWCGQEKEEASTVYNLSNDTFLKVLLVVGCVDFFF